MLLSDLPMVQEIASVYRKLRENGCNRDEATAKLTEQYRNEILIGADDDGLFFSIGLADAQYACKELSASAAACGIEALRRLELCDLSIPKLDIERRKKHYSSAPMPEKKEMKRTSKNIFPWNVGDTFAYQLRGPYAERYKVEGKYYLLRVVGFGEDAHRCYPIVTVTFWESEPLPQNEQEFQAGTLLKVNAGGRGGSSEDLFEYRTMILAKSFQQVKNFPLQYLGNFQDVCLPEDEIIFSNPWFCTLSNLSEFDRSCGLIWRMNKYCTQGIILPFP